mmetsp:Transcript_47938/g.147664  ORF Transcript_47938/g.147664 Transcript_47938/m.147664 type:complete len:205 (+) Transcript_47938:928-1542(+)
MRLADEGGGALRLARQVDAEPVVHQKPRAVLARVDAHCAQKQRRQRTDCGGAGQVRLLGPKERGVDEELRPGRRPLAAARRPAAVKDAASAASAASAAAGRGGRALGALVGTDDSGGARVEKDVGHARGVVELLWPAAAPVARVGHGDVRVQAEDEQRLQQRRLARGQRRRPASRHVPRPQHLVLQPHLFTARGVKRGGDSSRR